MKPKQKTSSNHIAVSKKPVKPIFPIAIGLGILIVLILVNGKFSAFHFGRSTDPTPNVSTVPGTNLVAGSPEKFAFLSGQGAPRSVVNNCGLQPSAVEAMPDDARIQGSCCQAMDLKRYQEQVEGLKKYADIPQVPSDPYDVPISLVKQLLEYDRTIQLTADEQAIYDQASQMADDKGPCCCKCWRWYAYEGQAKYLISRLHWSAEQVATLWDTEEGCGGPGHEQSTILPMPMF